MSLKNYGLRYFIAIPDLFSIMNLIFGFLAILMFINGNLRTGVEFMFISLIFDSIDGWVARKIGREDVYGFGKNIDSLCDIVSFAVAPAIFLLFLGKNFDMQYIIILISLIIIVFGMLRLARYNSIPYDEKLKDKFIGVPIPVTVVLLSSFYLSGIFNFEIAIILMFLLSLLMISSFTYPKITDIRLIIPAFFLMLLSLLVKSVPINIPALMLFILILLYIFITPVQSFIRY